MFGFFTEITEKEMQHFRDFILDIQNDHVLTFQLLKRDSIYYLA